MFLGNVYLRMQGTLDIRICIYKGIEIGGEEHVPKNSESDILGKGKRKQLRSYSHYLGLSIFLYLSMIYTFIIPQ